MTLLTQDYISASKMERRTERNSSIFLLCIMQALQQYELTYSASMRALAEYRQPVFSYSDIALNILIFDKSFTCRVLADKNMENAFSPPLFILCSKACVQ